MLTRKSKSCVKAEKEIYKEENLGIMKMKIVGVCSGLFTSVTTSMQGNNKAFFFTQMGKYYTYFKDVKDGTQKYIMR